MMKKLLIVNNNMKVGGVQKSLYNLLWSLDPAEYAVTLLLFSKIGVYLDCLPDTVRVVECGGPFRLFGKSQAEYKGREALTRGFLAAISRLLGREAAVRLMLPGQPMLEDRYDCAVSFLQNGRREAFYGGAQDYVLHRVKADRKVAWLHCDYQKCGADHRENNRMMERFDAVAACSEGCRRSFAAALPQLAERCVAVPNCHRVEEILDLAQQDPVTYPAETVNVVTVARLTHEKGLERAIRAVAVAQAKGLPVRLHLVGAGPMKEALQTLTEELRIREAVAFYGEQPNPYRYMKNADLLLLSSYHEAAPMVIDEARCLGLPVLTTATTSSTEMVAQAKAGWVCDNSQEALTETLCRVAADREGLQTVKHHLNRSRMDNRAALAGFRAVVNGG